MADVNAMVDSGAVGSGVHPARPPMWQEALATARVLSRQEATWYGVAALAALVVCFWPLIAKMPTLWFEPETYYNHGPLIPLIAGYLVYDRWDAIKDRRVKPVYWALIPLAFLLYGNYIAMSAPRDLFMSVALVGTLLLGVLFTAGWGWLAALAVPILYLFVGLPVWEQVIDVYTQPLQAISSDLAYTMLSGIGLNVMRDANNPTTLYMDHFQMYVGVPCSGLRTLLAMVAMLGAMIVIGRLPWWKNLALVALALPICVLVNGFRIATIGLVGESFGDAAGHQFHDYGGYISLALLMFLTYKISQRLGVKI